MPALSVWSRDGMLGAIAPLGLAAAAGTAIVVDLDRSGPRYPGSATLKDLVDRGPTRAELEPQRRGVCVVANGGVDAANAAPVLDAIAAGWPHAVFRIPSAAGPPPSAVQVHPLVPGGLFAVPHGPRIVVQASGWRLPVPVGSVVLPRPGRATLDALLGGRLPRPGDRWVKAWIRVWERPWTG